MGEYRFAEAADTVYHAIWHDVADWYLEASKETPNPSVLGWVLETALKLAHPFVPFVTETIWTTLEGDRPLLITSPWPTKPIYNTIAAAEFERLQELVIETRFVATELSGGKQTLFYEHDGLVADNASLLQRLAGLAEVKHIEQPKGLRLAVPNREAWLEVDAETLYEHQSRLELRLAECKIRIAQLDGRLQNDNYVKQAPAAVVAETREQLSEQRELAERLGRELDVLVS
jgi:valyl-tRNA synthetase